jgi:hypothetical protein
MIRALLQKVKNRRFKIRKDEIDGQRAALDLPHSPIPDIPRRENISPSPIAAQLYAYVIG